MSEHRKGKHEDHEAGAQSGANGQTTADGQANGQAGADGQASADAQQPAAETQSAAGPQDELGAMRDRHLRLAAEFDNYRKRVERERGESWVRAQAQLAEKLLEPLDDLQRIADFDPATTSATALHEGAEMVEKKFLRALEAAGLEPIDAAGKPFDPTVHEAITTGPTSVREEDDTVGDVFQKGYRFKGVLLRPARVRVRKHEG
ncbi:MAG TPA: nucleotide exchange factor GrpE [Longimicrobiaceae bacterium]|jgi:molecular chaperone GrpE|nr:nucleotide exchange factor GrpE [Longimicrobiaceae bacterium]